MNRRSFFAALMLGLVLAAPALALGQCPTTGLPATVVGCAGSPHSLQASLSGGLPPYSFFWQGGSLQDPVLVATTPGIYVFEYADAAGCQGSDTVQLSFAPQVALPETLYLCTGSSLSLDAGNPGATYAWSTGAQTQSLQVGVPGTYSVVASLPGGCTDSDTVHVLSGGSVPQVEIDPLGPTSFCQGNNVVLDAGPGLPNYLWNTGETSRAIVVSVSGSYTVSTTTACTTKTSNPVGVNVLPVPPTPSIVPNGSLLLCPQPGSYQWLLDGVAIPGATQSSYAATSTGLYTVVLRNSQGCSSSSLPVYVDVLSRTGLLAEAIRVYPNPAQHWLQLQLPAGVPVVAYLVSLPGQTVLQQQWASAPHQALLHLPSLAAGMYRLQLVLPQGTVNIPVQVAP